MNDKEQLISSLFLKRQMLGSLFPSISPRPFQQTFCAQVFSVRISIQIKLLH